MKFILNELSISEVNSQEIASQKYKTFFETCIETKQYKCCDEKNKVLLF